MTIEQSVPTVDALHVVNKKHTEELKRKDDQIEALKKEMQNVRDRNDNQMKQLRAVSYTHLTLPTILLV